ncbi:MAG: ExbD/TolR family protein [Blastocatellia bacterium]
MSFQAEDRRRPATPVINVTPLVDILLVLLIIFMVIAPAKPFRFAAQTPGKTDPGQVENPMPAVVIKIAGDGALQLNNQAILEGELVTRLEKLMMERPADDRNVFINGAAALRYQSVVRIIDMAKQAGALRQGLVADQVN